MSILASTGWSQNFLDAFQSVGQIAAAVQYQQSGAAKSAQEIAEAEKQKQYDLIAEKQAQGYTQQTSVIASVVDVAKIKSWFLSNWMIIAAAILLLLVVTGRLKIPFLRRKNNPGRSSRRSSRRSIKVSKPSRPSVSKSTGFSRKIKGVTYTSRKAWAEKMQSLRKKK